MRRIVPCVLMKIPYSVFRIQIAVSGELAKDLVDRGDDVEGEGLPCMR